MSPTGATVRNNYFFYIFVSSWLTLLKSLLNICSSCIRTTMDNGAASQHFLSARLDCSVELT